MSALLLPRDRSAILNLGVWFTLNSFPRDGHLASSDGYLQFKPVSGQLGSLPLPQSTLNSAVEKLLSSPENREKLRLPDGVRDIQVVDGHLVVNYR